MANDWKYTVTISILTLVTLVLVVMAASGHIQ